MLIALNIFSQNNYTRKLKWACNSFEIEGEKVYYFEGADFIDSVTPTYFERFTLNKAEIESVTINNIKYELAEINSPDIANIGTDVKFEYKIGTEKKKNYLYLTVYPYIKSSSNNTILKIVEFNITIIEKENNVLKNIKSHTYASNSVLSIGKWIKIKISKDGVYKITYDELIIMGFETPENIHIYGNGGEMLSEMNNVFRNDDIVDNPIFIEKGNDNIFNSGDYLLFYGKGSVKWFYDDVQHRFIHSLHKFSEASYYFITSNNTACNEIYSIDNISLTSNKTVNTFNDYQFYEKEINNLIKSGNLWFGEHFNNDSTFYDFSFNFPNIVTTNNIKLTSYFAARSSLPSSFIVNANGSLVQNISLTEANIGSNTASYATTQLVTNMFVSSNSNILVTINYSPSNSSSEGWLNYLELNTRRYLKMYGSQMHFRDVESVGLGNISEFNIENTNSNLRVWDITNYLSPKNLIYNISDSTIKFKTSTDTLKQFVVFENTNYLIPEIIGKVLNQDLHALPQSDFIIVTHPDFLSYANELADLHRNNDNMSVIVVTPEQIYNEFSSGSPDISAIRDFVKMFYDRSSSTQDLPKYLLLFGDGSYDNRTISSTNSNYILTYQSTSSLKPTESFCSDDFFSLLDDSEGGASGFEDIGVGRLPARNSTEATTVLNKIKNYITPVTFGDWRNTLCFIGDDEDANQHMNQADALATKIDTAYPAFNIEKIYLDAFQQISTPEGERYPDVNVAITNRITNGTLILNYTGRGNVHGLANEKVVELTDINSWNNFNKLFLMFTATAEFSRFDNYELTSAGEQVLLNPNGGSIALLSTTRLTYSTPNYILNDKFYNYIFSRDSNDEHLRLGEVMRLTKVNSGSSYNKRNFALLGDPALKLAIPENSVVTTEILCNSLNCNLDTILALTNVTVKGKVTDFQGNFQPTINDALNVIVFDKKRSYSTLSNDGGAALNYKEQKDKLFEGSAEILNGEFEFSFVVPDSISFGVGKGKISYYFSTDSFDGNGFDNSFILQDTLVNIENNNSELSYCIIYPNPFNFSTTIEYALSNSENVKIELLNILGSKIAVLKSENQTSGKHSTNFSKKELNLTSGLYYIRFEIASKIYYKKFIVI